MALTHHSMKTYNKSLNVSPQTRAMAVIEKLDGCMAVEETCKRNGVPLPRN